VADEVGAVHGAQPRGELHQVRPHHLLAGRMALHQPRRRRRRLQVRLPQRHLCAGAAAAVLSAPRCRAERADAKATA